MQCVSQVNNLELACGRYKEQLTNFEILHGEDSFPRRRSNQHIRAAMHFSDSIDRIDELRLRNLQVPRINMHEHGNGQV